MARIGIYGGSFNPPHLGHIFAARKARQLLGLDKILLIPAAIPPHKAVAEGSPDGETRFALTQLAISGETGMEVSRIELDRPGPSYTVDTLRELRESYPQDELYLLMGTDMFLSFFQWREPEAIAALAVPVCMARVRADAALSAQLLAQQEKMEAVFGVRPIVLQRLSGNFVDRGPSAPVFRHCGRGPVPGRAGHDRTGEALRRGRRVSCAAV